MSGDLMYNFVMFFKFNISLLKNETLH